MNGEVGEDFVSWDDELWMPKGRKGKKPEEHDQHEIPSRSPLVNSSVPKTKNDSWSEIRLPVRNSLDDFLHQLEDLDIVVRLEVNLPHRNTHTPVNILRGQAAWEEEGDRRAYVQSDVKSVGLHEQIDELVEERDLLVRFLEGSDVSIEGKKHGWGSFETTWEER
jgi:hypothetical protein